MTPAELEIALRTLPEGAKMLGAKPGSCWGFECRSRVLWPRTPHPPCIVRCDSSWPHVGVATMADPT